MFGSLSGVSGCDRLALLSDAVTRPGLLQASGRTSRRTSVPAVRSSTAIDTAGVQPDARGRKAALEQNSAVPGIDNVRRRSRRPEDHAASSSDQQRGFRDSDLTEVAIYKSLAAPLPTTARPSLQRSQEASVSNNAAGEAAAEPATVSSPAEQTSAAAFKAKRLLYASTQAGNLHTRRNVRRLQRRSELAQGSAAAAAALAGVEPAAIEAAAQRDLLGQRQASASLAPTSSPSSAQHVQHAQRASRARIPEAHMLERRPRVTRPVHDTSSVLRMIGGQASTAALLSGKEQLDLWHVMRKGLAIEEGQQQFEEEFGRRPSAAELATALGFPSVRHLYQCLAEGREAKEQLLQANVRMVLKLVYRWTWQQDVPLEDLALAGLKGLETGLRRFDPSRGAGLTTALYYYIQDAVHKGYGTMSRTVRLPQYILDSAPAIARVVKQYKLDNGGRLPSDQELHALTGVSFKTVRRIRGAWSQTREQSLNALQPGMDGSAETGELLEDPLQLAPDEAAFEMELRRTVDASLDKLGRLLPQHSQIMAMLYGLDDGIPKTSKQVASKLGLTAAKVRDMKKRAMRALRTDEYARLHQLADDRQLAISYSQ